MHIERNASALDKMYAQYIDMLRWLNFLFNAPKTTSLLLFSYFLLVLKNQ